MPTGEPSLSAIDALISSGPMPIAQLARRARNSKTGAAMLQNAAHYLGEAGAALAASYWLGRALSVHDEPTETMQRHLAAMVGRGSSFGKWVGLLRESAAAVGGDSLSGLLKPLSDVTPIESLISVLTEQADQLGEDGKILVSKLKQTRKHGLLGFFDFLVTFRNKVYGHGTMLPEAVCRQLASPVLAAVAHVLRQPELFEECWLGRTGIDLLSDENRRYWKRLHGTSEAALGPADDRPDPAEVSPLCLHFVPTEGPPISLSFLVVQDEDVTGLSRFGFFQKVVGLRLEDAEFDASSVKTIDYLAHAQIRSGRNPIPGTVIHAEDVRAHNRPAREHETPQVSDPHVRTHPPVQNRFDEAYRRVVGYGTQDALLPPLFVVLVFRRGLERVRLQRFIQPVDEGRDLYDVVVVRGGIVPALFLFQELVGQLKALAVPDE